MDISVKPDQDGAWSLIDLLGRSMGSVVRNPVGEFSIVTTGDALGRLPALRRGPFVSLDAALSEIELRTRGNCRMASEEPSK
jgi:hypothetical protein